MRFFTAILLLLSYTPQCPAQDDFQLLRSEAQGFAEVVPGKRFEFPRDHAAHPDYRIEWWYITANLRDQQGRHWGLQWTLFRNALSPGVDPGGWQSNQIWMAHAAISSPEGHSYEQRFARGGIGQAGVTVLAQPGQFDAWLDDWQWSADNSALFPSTLSFSVDERQVEMRLESSAHWVLQGDRGYSQKSVQGQASYYYSQPNIRISGSIESGGIIHRLSGTAWLDREWSSQALAQNQEGWDWFSMHLDDGHSLMLYRLRETEAEHWLSGSWVDAEGGKRHLSGEEIRLTPERSAEIGIDRNRRIIVPLEWKIELPGLGKHWRVKALYDQQWMGTRFAYWEGVVLVEDESGDSAGVGYMELTGYD